MLPPRTAPPPTPALQARGLCVDRGPRRVLDHVDLEVDAGVVTALIGPNGSGKTTLLKALAGVLPFSGQVLVKGRALDTLDRRARARHVAYVPQQSALDAPLPVFDVVAQGRLAHRAALGGLSRADLAAIDDALVATDVKMLAPRAFTSLSHGEKHRVLIARGLATEAPVLLLDEPTAGLDLAHVLELLDLFTRLAAEGRSLLVVLHPLAEVKAVAARVAVLHEGKRLAYGPVPEVLTPALVREVYRVDVVPGGAWGFAPLAAD